MRFAHPKDWSLQADIRHFSPGYFSFLGQTLLDKIWTDVAKALVTYADHANYEIRNAAAYGIGMFAQNTTQNFSTYANDILDAVVRSLKFPSNVPKTEKDDMKFSKDNSISALGKIMNKFLIEILVQSRR